jgi:hypothetical protein
VAAPALDDAYHRVVESLAQEPPPMTKPYQIVPPPGSPPTLDPEQLAEPLAKESQLILTLLDLLENAQCALDDLIDVMGRATIEAVLRMSAARFGRIDRSSQGCRCALRCRRTDAL